MNNSNLSTEHLSLAVYFDAVSKLELLLEAHGNKAAAHIKSNCLVDGRLNGELLDRQQLASFDLAFVAADLAAVRACVAYAEALESDSSAQSVVLLFCADTLNTVLTKLIERTSEFGIDRGHLLSIYQESHVDSLLTYCISAEFQASVGLTIVEEDRLRLPSNLGEEKELMGASFFRFANDVVIPLAGAIHRQDLDIPDSILKPAAQLGCFGTCIPERFGGLQPDEAPDSLGMIVVTEELSRGSLGAAGSLITRPEIAARALLSGGTK